jgi:hypothetical protein
MRGRKYSPSPKNIMKYLKIITKKILKKLYITKKQSARFIAKELKVNEKTILKYLKFYNIIARKTRFVNGKNNPFYGKHHTRKTIIKLIQKNKGKKYSKEINHKKGHPLNLNYFWQGGKSFEPYTPEFNDSLKLIIRNRDNYKCQNCGMTEEEHVTVYGTVLHVHHIDYIKTNCTEENLISTCNNCNLRANYNRPYWQEFYTDKIIKIYSNIKN